MARGNKKIPTELKGVAGKAISELEKLAFDEETPVKMRAELLRWLTELELGKGGKNEEKKIEDSKINITLKVEE